MNKIRIYHAALASLALLAYMTGGMGIIHGLLGYGVGIIITLRLIWGLFDKHQGSLSRFKPSFKGLTKENLFTHPALVNSITLCLALSLIGAVLSGLLIVNSRAIGINNFHLIKELHEFFAGMMIFFALMHVVYMITFKLPFTKFMLFIQKPVIKNVIADTKNKSESESTKL